MIDTSSYIWNYFPGSHVFLVWVPKHAWDRISIAAVFDIALNTIDR